MSKTSKPKLKPKPFEPGINWMPERGKLYKFSNSGVIVIRPWPLPQAWQKREDSGWLPVCPRIDLRGADFPRRPVRRPKMGRSGEQLAWQTVPEPVRQAILQSHFSGFQWQALSMQGRCPGALELSQSAPMLAAMLATGNHFRPKPVGWLLRSVRSLLQTPDGWKRWIRICQWLGLDSSKSFIRMTRRAEIRPFSWTLRRWKAILNLWAHPDGRKLLQHASRITEAHGQLFEIALVHLPVEEAVRIIHPALFAELSEEGGYTGAPWVLGSTLQMWGAAWHERRLPRLTSVNQIEQLRAETLEQLEAVQLSDSIDWMTIPDDFPPTPLEPWPGMTPLDSEAALVREGREMNHCIGNGDWPRYARKRWGYGYTVRLGDERVTLWLSRVDSHPAGFSIEQLRAHGNMAPSPELAQYIHTWLATHAEWNRFRAEEGPKPSGPELPPMPETWAVVKRQLNPMVEMLLGDDIPF